MTGMPEAAAPAMVRSPDDYSARFRQIVEDHGSTIARTLRYLGVPSSELDDAVQEVFVVAHRRWSELNHDRSMGGWLRRVAVNVARNRRRSIRRSPTTTLASETADPRAAEDQLEERRRCEALLAMLDALPDEQRTAVVLFEIEALPMKEVAAVLGVSLPTAYRRLDDARAALRRALAKEES